MLNIFIPVLGLLSFVLILALFWFGSARPEWRVRLVIYGWGLIVLWALFWSAVVPAVLRGLVDESSAIRVLPDGSLVMGCLAAGWFWPIVVLGIRTFLIKRRRDSRSTH